VSGYVITNANAKDGINVSIEKPVIMCMAFQRIAPNVIGSIIRHVTNHRVMSLHVINHRLRLPHNNPCNNPLRRLNNHHHLLLALTDVLVSLSTVCQQMTYDALKLTVENCRSF
jgi:hypothetical protein